MGAGGEAGLLPGGKGGVEGVEGAVSLSSSSFAGSTDAAEPDGAWRTAWSACRCNCCNRCSAACCCGWEGASSAASSILDGAGGNTGRAGDNCTPLADSGVGLMLAVGRGGSAHDCGIHCELPETSWRGRMLRSHSSGGRLCFIEKTGTQKQVRAPTARDCTVKAWVCRVSRIPRKYLAT